MNQEKRLAAALYLGFYLTFVSWYQLPRRGSLLASDLETWPLGGLDLWGQLLAPFWVRPCLYVLCLAALTGFLWSLTARSSLASCLPGLAALLLFKLTLVAADLRLLAPAQTAHLVLTLAFLLGRPRLSCVRLSLIGLTLGAALQGGRPWLWAMVACGCLWLAPERRLRRWGTALYLLGQLLIWGWRGLTAPISAFSFEDSGFVLILAALALLPCSQPAWARVRWSWLGLGLLLALVVSGRLPCFEPRAWQKVVVRYTLEDGPRRCVVVASMPARSSWTDHPAVRVRGQLFENGRLTRDLERLTHPVEFAGRVVFAPGRFLLASPETMADPAFHQDSARRTGARVELFVGGEPDALAR